MNKHQALKEIESLKYELSELKEKYEIQKVEYTLTKKWYKSKSKDYEKLFKEATQTSNKLKELLDFIIEIDLMTTKKIFIKFQPNDDPFTEEPRFDTSEYYRFYTLKFNEIIKKAKSILDGD